MMLYVNNSHKIKFKAHQRGDRGGGGGGPRRALVSAYTRVLADKEHRG